ncbi:hypothetical protein LTR86_001685 [Recurvomyces mirabilis]|nr:hypothetical protein LTR86_001685 [Recurvomyces mirabilis]
MAAQSTDIVQLAKLDAEVSSDGLTTRHKYRTTARWGYGSVEKEAVWKRVSAVGSGGFSTVYKEEAVSGEMIGALRAVQSIHKPLLQHAGTINYERELEAVARFSQQKYELFFVQSYGWYDTSDAVLIVMEFVQHGDLQQHLSSPLPEREAQQTIKQTLQGLKHMHDLGYAHRDLKPQNMLVFSKAPHRQIKLADFGLSKRIVENATFLRTDAGTPAFKAPEIFDFVCDDDESSDDESLDSYTNAIDIWAVGIISFLLLIGQTPFPALQPRILRRYTRGKVALPVWLLSERGVDDQGCAMIRSFLTARADRRPSSSVSLEHVWLGGAPVSHEEPSLIALQDPGPVQRRESRPYEFVSLNPFESTDSARWTIQDSAYGTSRSIPAMIATPARCLRSRSKHGDDTGDTTDEPAITRHDELEGVISEQWQAKLDQATSRTPTEIDPQELRHPKVMRDRAQIMAKQLYEQQNRTPPLELGPVEAASILKGARLSTSEQIKIEQEAQRYVDIEEAARKVVQEHQAAVAKDLERAKYREDHRAQYQQQKAERESSSARQSIPSRGHRLADKGPASTTCSTTRMTMSRLPGLDVEWPSLTLALLA